MEPEYIDNPIKEFISLSSKCYSYICKNDMKDNENKLKNNIVHSKGISNSYKNKYIDHMLFKKTLIIYIKFIRDYLVIIKYYIWILILYMQN